MISLPRVLLALVLIGVVIIGGVYFFRPKHVEVTRAVQPTPTAVKTSTGEKVKYPEDFTIVLVGDSMTERLGNSDEIRAYLKEYYPNKTVEVLNYGFGSTNILSLQDRLTKTTFHTRDFRPILDIDFDLIIIESFGNNPLSQFALEEGLKKQNEALEKAVETIKNSNPRAKIVFMGTISPNSRSFALGQVDLKPEVRAEWVRERVAYTKNHMEFARAHGIPVIDVFSKSLNKSGDGDVQYIDKDDHIHPSPSGIYLISHATSDFIHESGWMQ